MPSLDAGDQLLGGRPAGGRLQRHVGHPLDRHVPGESAKAQPLDRPRPSSAGHPPVELVADQDAVADQVPGLAGARPRRRSRSVASPCSAVRSPVTCMSGEPYCRLPSLSEGGERRARVGGLVAERPVELGGVADGLVDGQPQVGRVDHQVVAAGLDRRAPPACRPAARAARRARRPSPSPSRSGTPSHGRPAGASVRMVSNRAVGCRPRRRSAPGAAGPAAGSWWCRQSA